MSGPLDGMRVLDLTSVVMGPYTTRILADMGAEVIKVETRAGDSTRRLGPERHPGMGYYFLNLNRDKRSIVLDLKHSSGVEALMRLAAKADVIVSNIRPKAMARLGITYESLSKLNARIVYASLVGYDQGGPYAGNPAYDDLMQAAVGLPALAARAGDKVPRYAPLNLSDRVVALAAVNAILGALLMRATTGHGQAVEVPMFETMADFVLVEHLGGLTFDPPAGPSGYSRTLTKYRNPFPTKDGYISAQVYNDKHWRAFFTICGMQDRYSNDPRFADLGARTRHMDDVYLLIAEVMRTRTTDEWLKLLQDADIPATRMHTIESILDDPQLEATGFFQFADHPSEGTIRTMRPPTRWSTQSDDHPGRHAPRLGEHSSEVLAEAGYSQQEIAQLVADKVAFQASR